MGFKKIDQSFKFENSFSFTTGIDIFDKVFLRAQKKKGIPLKSLFLIVTDTSSDYITFLNFILKNYKYLLLSSKHQNTPFFIYPQKQSTKHETTKCDKNAENFKKGHDSFEIKKEIDPKETGVTKAPKEDSLKVAWQYKKYFQQHSEETTFSFNRNHNKQPFLESKRYLDEEIPKTKTVFLDLDENGGINRPKWGERFFERVEKELGGSNYDICLSTFLMDISTERDLKREKKWEILHCLKSAGRIKKKLIFCPVSQGGLSVDEMHLADYVVSLNSFANIIDGKSKDKKEYGDYDGVINVLKAPSLNRNSPESCFLYKNRAASGRFVVERFSLPPELMREDQTEGGIKEQF